MSKRKFSYYDFGRVLSYNAVINMIMGARGLGKTYGAKKIVIKNAIERGEEFIYLRRYRPELKNRDNFFSDIAHEFPGYEFRVNGPRAEYRLEGDDKWKTMGYFQALSIAGHVKSVAFPLVTTIIYDEFIIEQGVTRFLPDEVTKFLDFYSTVDRYQDKTRVFMLSNAVTIMNPYFAAWGVTPEKELTRFGDGFVVAHFVDSEKFAREVMNTRFGRFIKDFSGTYADYAVQNDFRDNDGRLVAKKDSKAQYDFSIRCSSGAFSVWVGQSAVFFQRRQPKKVGIMYTITDDVREGEIGLVRNDKICQWLRRKYRAGRLFFDSPQSRNGFQELFL